MEDEMVAEHKNLSNDIQSLRMVLSHQEENFSSFYGVKSSRCFL